MAVVLWGCWSHPAASSQRSTGHKYFGYWCSLGCMYWESRVLLVGYFLLYATSRVKWSSPKFDFRCSFLVLWLPLNVIIQQSLTQQPSEPPSMIHRNCWKYWIPTIHVCLRLWIEQQRFDGARVGESIHSLFSETKIPDSVGSGLWWQQTYLMMSGLLRSLGCNIRPGA